MTALGSPRRIPAPPAIVALGVLLLFLAAGLYDLGRSPRVYEDESLIAAPGALFARTGVFGSTLDPGFFGAERHFYGFMPLFSMLQTALEAAFQAFMKYCAGRVYWTIACASTPPRTSRLARPKKSIASTGAIPS